MRLGTKLNLILATVALLGVLFFALLSTPFLQSRAKAEVIERARIMMLSAAGIRKYTADRIAPLLLNDMAETFHPEAVSSVAAVANFEILRATFADYSYREPALNPTNLADRASDWEADIIRHFRDNPSAEELISARETPTGPVLNLAQPIVAYDACLACHDRWEDAPTTMVAKYGTQNGFGWQEGEIIGAQIVSVPMAVPLQAARDTRLVFILLLIGVFAILFILLNLFLKFVIVRPVAKMTDVAQRVSVGEAGVPEYSKKGSDEIADLSEAFNRVRRSMEEALKLLKS